MAEEEALGNLPVKSEGKAKRAYKVKPLRDYLKQKWPMQQKLPILQRKLPILWQQGN
jgi:hypothetical protein